MRRTTKKEIEAVLRLDGPSRFEHFVKRVVDEERAWSLWRDGWAMMADNADSPCLPLWPAAEYAELHRTDDWTEHEVRALSLEDLLGELIPRLAERGAKPAVFPTPNGKGVIASPAELADALRSELLRYE